MFFVFQKIILSLNDLGRNVIQYEALLHAYRQHLRRNLVAYTGTQSCQLEQIAKLSNRMPMYPNILNVGREERTKRNSLQLGLLTYA